MIKVKSCATDESHSLSTVPVEGQVSMARVVMVYNLCWQKH